MERGRRERERERERENREGERGREREGESEIVGWEGERERTDTMGLSGLPQNMKYDLCKFCTSQRVLTTWLRQNLHNECFVFRSNPRRKPVV